MGDISGKYAGHESNCIYSTERRLMWLNISSDNIILKDNCKNVLKEINELALAFH